jgi:hypothetical protein
MMRVSVNPSRVPAAENCTVPFTATVAVPGEIVSVVRFWVPVASSHAAVISPASPSAVRALRIPRRGPRPGTPLRFFMKIFIHPST